MATSEASLRKTAAALAVVCALALALTNLPFVPLATPDLPAPVRTALRIEDVDLGVWGQRLVAGNETHFTSWWSDDAPSGEAVRLLRSAGPLLEASIVAAGLCALLAIRGERRSATWFGAAAAVLAFATAALAAVGLHRLFELHDPRQEIDWAYGLYVQVGAGLGLGAAAVVSAQRTGSAGPVAQPPDAAPLKCPACAAQVAATPSPTQPCPACGFSG